MTQHSASDAPSDLDSIDRQIIAELSRDARLSMRALAVQVHISRTAAHTRVHRLVTRGVITGFGAQTDRKSLGLHVSALVVVKIGDVSWGDIAARLAALPYVEKAQAVSGDIDIILTVNAPSHELLSQAILRDIHSMPGVVSTRSHLILEEISGHMPGTVPDVWR
ncbi:Lrp/AsnC family transcriptional regulator [Cryobacterium roopkundense]|uniref:DNA-binding Lrp family transcriptional regulator n=1 Tax=Cryobacterium roopkundense TaxID=1001240 RepID=A0A7W8ZWG7_9MICO|nr:Lrp/AsnC family transcriptional regulator [Cryobacterium roopkundense]MBB5641442.1 DNA-binding Lrp family transcriptional regulator [Cryobacterium roopkundense]